MEKVRFVDYLNDYLDFNNITNKDFANRIGITPKHLIDIMSGKCELTAPVIEAISIVTSIPSDYIYRMELNCKFETDILDYLKKNNLTKSQFLNKFAYQYLIKNEWINFIDKDDKLEIIKDILKFLRVKSPEKIYEIDNKIFFKSKNNKKELLLLWLEKCYKESLKQEVSKYSKDNITILVDFIRDLAEKEIFDEEKLIKKFNENGVALVIQEDIPGSKIRGAFKVHKDVPAIYITYKHNRIADIYFALLHELAHCKRDFNKAKSTNLISFDDMYEDEIDADIQAYDWMVDEKYYASIKNNINYDITAESTYPKCFIVYKFAKDGLIDYASDMYQKYNCILNFDKK